MKSEKKIRRISLVYLKMKTKKNIHKHNCNFRWTNIGYLSIKLAIEHGKTTKQQHAIRYSMCRLAQTCTQKYKKNEMIERLMRFLFLLLSTVLMLKMDKEHDHRWKVVRRARVLFYKIFHNAVNHFFIDLIPTLKCHQNQCLGIPALQAKGKSLSNYQSKQITKPNIERRKFPTFE